jgi:hypothetical protein
VNEYGALLEDHQNLTGGLQPCFSVGKRTRASPCSRTLEVVVNPHGVLDTLG